MGVMPGASIENLQSKDYQQSDIDGVFLINARKGDSILIKFTGYDTKTIIANPNNQNIAIEMTSDNFDIDSIGGATLNKGNSFFKRLFHSIGNIFR